MHVQLIVPALEGFRYTRKSGCPPLGLSSIATYLTQQEGEKEVKIEIIDGELIADNNAIIARIQKGALVGILTKTPNYSGAVKIAQAAKEKSCVVVFGGVYATNMAETILHQRHEIVDFVVKGFGEKPMLRILRLLQSGQPFSEERIITEPTPAFDEICWSTRDWFDMDRYIANFTADRPTWCLGRGTNIFTHMGCVHKCDFCSRMGPLGGGVYWRNPKNIWGEVTELAAKHGVDYVLDFSDTITQNPRWLQMLVDTRPTNLQHIRWHVFSTAERIPDTIKLLQRLNVVHVFVGVETGDEVVANNVLKGRKFSPSLVRHGISELSSAGIRATPSFVYGLRGETEASMAKTFQFAKEIVDLSGAEEIFASEFIPWPGAPAWEAVKKFFTTDILDIEELKRVWLQEVVHIDTILVREYVDKTLTLAKYPISVQGS